MFAPATSSAELIDGPEQGAADTARLVLEALGG